MTHGAIMLGQPLQRLPRQVEPVEARIGAFDPRQRAQRVAIMVKAAMRLHRALERILPRMAKGWMADIVRETQRLGQILVEPERAGDAAADLRDLDAVGQANAVMIAVGRDEHLRLVAQAAKGDRRDEIGREPGRERVWKYG